MATTSRPGASLQSFSLPHLSGCSSVWPFGSGKARFFLYFLLFRFLVLLRVSTSVGLGCGRRVSVKSCLSAAFKEGFGCSVFGPNLFLWSLCVLSCGSFVSAGRKDKLAKEGRQQRFCLLKCGTWFWISFRVYNGSGCFRCLRTY